MKRGKSLICAVAVTILIMLSGFGAADEVYRLRLFFGLSLPGGGAVSLYEWQQFEREKLSKAFDGFNVVDSTGYYKGKPERSKIVTLIVGEKDIEKAKELAKNYAKKFHQESVMIVKVPVSEWSFVDGKE